jgi:hypothetical protein
MREDACHAIVHSGDLGTRHWDINIQEIRVPEVEGIRTSQVSKSRRDQNHPSLGGRMAAIGAI